MPGPVDQCRDVIVTPAVVDPWLIRVEPSPGQRRRRNAIGQQAAFLEGNEFCVIQHEPI